jgi:hypothetical protein
MKKVMAAVLFVVLLLSACGQKETIEGVFIEEVELKQGLMLADLFEAGWTYDTEIHTDEYFLDTPVGGGETVMVKMLLTNGTSRVELYCKSKDAGRTLLSECPVSRFVIYPGDIGNDMTLPGGVTFNDNKSNILKKLGKPLAEGDYALIYENVPGIADITFILKDDMKKLDRIEISMKV